MDDKKRLHSDSSDNGVKLETVVPPVPADEHFDDDSSYPTITLPTFMMAMLVGLGGICWGFDTGQISGFQEMRDFRFQFGNIRDEDPPRLSELRTALIVALLSIGTLVGALVAGPIANKDKIGRKYSISIWCAVLAIGNIFQVASQFPYWEVMLVGRIVAGFGVGGLSVVTPAYTSESAPAHIRGTTVSCYNLFVTLGQVIANLVNFGTNELTGPVQWRLPIGLGWVWCVALGVGVLFFPETPRHDYRHGRIDRASETIAKYYGVSRNHKVIKNQLAEMQAKLLIEQEGTNNLLDIFTAPRMLYRVLLGMAVMAYQQLTGINFFMYFGTTLFTGVGMENPFITAIILGAVNCIGTIPGLYMVEKFGRRKCLSLGAAFQCVTFLIYASLGQFALPPADGSEGNNNTIGYLMIVFACLFIFCFAATWGPMAWTVISEIFPSQFRSMGIALSCASVWIFNFYIAFSTSFVINAIGFAYGYFFAACNLAAALTIFFFLPETSQRSLEEIDTMFLLEIRPWKSSSWKPPAGDELLATDARKLSEGGRRLSIAKSLEADRRSGAEDTIYIEDARR